MFLAVSGVSAVVLFIVIMLLENYIIYILIPVTAGFLLDFVFGDPAGIIHPVVCIGKLISCFERLLLREESSGSKAAVGAVTAVLVSVIVAFIPLIILLLLHKVCCIFCGNDAEFFYKIFAAGILSLMCYQMIAAKSLRTESMKVYAALSEGDTEGARRAVSMIVGRDTSGLSEKGIIRAAVETVAENTGDGVTAPLFYMSFFGIVGMYFYKAVNTLDSMIGYKNDKYIDFGRWAARMDDAVNFIPSRITALFMIIGAFVMPGFDGKAAYRIFRRDRLKHASPNSAQTESVCAGALNVRLAGPAVYFGRRVEKEYIGDDVREIEYEDIRRANRLMYFASVSMTAAMAAVSLLIVFAAARFL